MPLQRTRRVVLAAVAVGAVLLLCAPLAQASGVLGSGVGPNVGPDLNPLPSIAEVLSGVVHGLFGALLAALTPSFLRHADIATLEWLVALPNVADTSVWPTVGRLEANMVWVAGAIIPTALIIATARDTALSLSFRAHPGNALLRVVGAVFWLVLYRFAFGNAVAFINVLTHAMLSWSIVAQGLHRTVLVMFGGSLLVGTGGVFLAVLGLVALVLAICLFALKVLLLMVLAVLFVAGPLFIALTPLPTVGDLARGWLLAVVGVCLIPVGWCVILATAGAISLDVTNLGAGANIGGRVVGAFSALATFYIALKWPLMVLGHVRSGLGGLGVRTAVASASGGVVSDGALAAKAQRARVGLRASMLAGGRGVGLAAGALGAPRGGLVGLAARQARPPLAAAAASGAIALGPRRAQPRQGAAGKRLARAGDALRKTPTRMREAWRAAGKPPPATRTSSRAGRDRAAGGLGGTRRKGSGRSRAPAVGAPDGSPRSADRAAEGSRDSRRAPVVPPRGSPRAEPGRPRAGPGSDAGREASARGQVSAPAQPRGGDVPSDAPRAAKGPSTSEQPEGRAQPDARRPRPARPNRSPRPSPYRRRPSKGDQR